jgi:hypothetical protein
MTYDTDKLTELARRIYKNGVPATTCIQYRGSDLSSGKLIKADITDNHSTYPDIHTEVEYTETIFRNDYTRLNASELIRYNAMGKVERDRFMATRMFRGEYVVKLRMTVV